MAKILLIQYELEYLYPVQGAPESHSQCLPSALLSVLCEGFTVTEGKQACIHPPSSVRSCVSIPSSSSSPQGQWKLLRAGTHRLDIGGVPSSLERTGDLGCGCEVLGSPSSSATVLLHNLEK